MTIVALLLDYEVVEGSKMWHSKNERKPTKQPLFFFEKPPFLEIVKQAWLQNLFWKVSKGALSMKSFENIMKSFS